MIKKIKVSALLCHCSKCNHEWVTIGENPPTNCRNKQCRSREWNGRKKKSHREEIKLPAPRRSGRPTVITQLGGDFDE